MMYPTSKYSDETDPTMSFDTPDSVIASLRREVVDANNGKAEMEREYLNLLSSLENNKKAAIDLLETRLREKDDVNASLKRMNERNAAQVSDVLRQADELRNILSTERASHRVEIDRMANSLEQREVTLQSQLKETQLLKSSLRRSEEKNGLLRKEVRSLRASRRQSPSIVGVTHSRKSESWEDISLIDDEKSSHSSNRLLEKKLLETESKLMDKEHELDALQFALQSCEGKNMILNDEKDRLMKKLSIECNRVESLETEINELNKRNQNHTKMLDTMKKETLSGLKEINRLEETMAEGNQIVKTKTREAEKAEASLIRCREEKEMLSNELKVMQSQLEREISRGIDLKRQFDILQSGGGDNFLQQAPDDENMLVEKEESENLRKALEDSYRRNSDMEMQLLELKNQISSLERINMEKTGPFANMEARKSNARLADLERLLKEKEEAILEMRVEMGYLRAGNIRTIDSPKCVSKGPFPRDPKEKMPQEVLTKYWKRYVEPVQSALQNCAASTDFEAMIK